MARNKCTECGPAPVMPREIQISPEAWREGHLRAVRMFRDIQATSNDELDCADDCRNGRPQENIVYNHFLSLLSHRDEGVLAAFSSVLTHYIGSTEHGGVPDIEGESGIAMEMRQPIRTQLGRPSRARVMSAVFSGATNNSDH